MSVDLEAIQEVLQLHHARRAELIELRRRGESTNFLAKCKQLFHFLESRQDGLAHLVEAALDLAGAYGEIGDWAAAEPIFEKCVAVRRAVCGTCDETTATARGDRRSSSALATGILTRRRGRKVIDERVSAAVRWVADVAGELLAVGRARRLGRALVLAAEDLDLELGRTAST